MGQRAEMEEPGVLKKSVILFIDSLGGGGAERVASVLCNELASQAEYQVEIVMLWKTPIQYELSDRIRLHYADDLDVTSIYGRFIRALFGLYKRIRQRIVKPILIRVGCYQCVPKLDETKFYFYAKYAIPYREYLKKKGDCTALGFLIRSNIAMLMAAKGTKAKTVFCERNNPVRQDIAPNLIRMRDKLSHSCDSGVFQTEDQKNYYMWIQKPNAVIPNPIKSGLPAPFDGIRRHEIVNFCRLSRQKNLLLLIDAFELLHKTYPDYRLSIYGNGDEKETLQQYIREKNLQEMISIKDFQPNIHEVILDAAMFVSTSDYEGISNSMIEAMAIGLPCVCTDCDGGGARMMIQDHKNGLLVPKGDAEGVYRAMKELIENPELAESLGKEATKIRERLSAEKIAEEWLKLI